MATGDINGFPVHEGAALNSAGEKVNFIDKDYPEAFASLDIRSDKVNISPAPDQGRHFYTAIRHGGAALVGQQVYFNLISPSKIVVLSDIAVTLRFVLPGSVWSDSERRFTTLVPGGRFVVPASAKTELTTSAVGLTVETAAALTSAQSIQILVEGSL